MAATLQDLLSQIRGKQEIADIAARAEARKPRNAKLALDILRDYKFPEGNDTPTSKDPNET